MEQEINLINAFVAAPREYKVTEMEALATVPKPVNYSPEVYYLATVYLYSLAQYLSSFGRKHAEAVDLVPRIVNCVQLISNTPSPNSVSDKSEEGKMENSIARLGKLAQQVTNTDKAILAPLANYQPFAASSGLVNDKFINIMMFCAHRMKKSSTGEGKKLPHFLTNGQVLINMADYLLCDRRMLATLQSIRKGFFQPISVALAKRINDTIGVIELYASDKINLLLHCLHRGKFICPNHQLLKYELLAICALRPDPDQGMGEFLISHSRKYNIAEYADQQFITGCIMHLIDWGAVDSLLLLAQITEGESKAPFVFNIPAPDAERLLSLEPRLEAKLGIRINISDGPNTVFTPEQRVNDTPITAEEMKILDDLRADVYAGGELRFLSGLRTDNTYVSNARYELYSQASRDNVPYNFRGFIIEFNTFRENDQLMQDALTDQFELEDVANIGFTQALADRLIAIGDMNKITYVLELAEAHQDVRMRGYIMISAVRAERYDILNSDAVSHDPGVAEFIVLLLTPEPTIAVEELMYLTYHRIKGGGGRWHESFLAEEHR